MTPADSRKVELVGQIGGATYAAVAVQGDHAYIGEGPRLTILDMSNPATPAVVGKTDLIPGIVRGVAVVGNYAYVADEGYGSRLVGGDDYGLRVVDVSDPAHPTPTPPRSAPTTRRDGPMAWRWRATTPMSPMSLGVCAWWT